MYLLLMSAVYTAVSDMSNFSCMWHCMDKVTSTKVQALLCFAALNGGLKIIGRHDKG